MSEHWRLFIGLPAPPHVRKAIVQRTAALRGSDARARWVAPANLHVTLLFLGDRAASDVPAIVASIEDVAGRHVAYELELNGAGAFGGGRRGRTLWLRVDRGRAETAALAGDLAASLSAADTADGRGEADATSDAKPHLTLARAAEPALIGRARVELNDAWFGWRVERAYLFRSRLGQGQPVYEELAAVPLGITRASAAASGSPSPGRSGRMQA